MREIKFRAWMEDKMLSHEDLVNIDQETHAMYSILTEPQEDITFMQFTGLKDKNGREIYEGDIWYDGHFPRLIKYDEEYAGFLPFVTDGGCGCCSEGGTGYRESDGEIIGNIYKNPELLAGENL